MAYQYDVREIKLIKTTTEHDLDTFVENKSSSGYVCLGHFDMMEIRKLAWDSASGDTPLDAICTAQGISDPQHASDELNMNYCYPLYIIQQIEEDKFSSSDIGEFWSKPSNYTVVTRLHCEQTGSQSKSFLQQLIARANEPRYYPNNKDELISPQHLGQSYCSLLVYLSSGTVPIHIAFYESLELGDIVAIIKCDSLVAVLETQRHLYECDIVSDSYSYYGIKKRIFCGDGCSILDKELGQPTLLSRTSLNYVSTRCSIRTAEIANDFLKEVKEWPVYKYAKEGEAPETPSSFFVSGTADLVIRWGMSNACNSISEKNFLMVLKGIIHSKFRAQAFYDIITRVGLPYVRPKNSRKDSPQKTDFKNRVSLYPNFLQFSKARRFASFDDVDNWHGQIARMLATLNTMYSNSVTDELSAMLLDGVDAFLDRLCSLADNPQAWKPWYYEDIHEFLDCWISLTNDITHIEGQLVQHPELNSIRYYFPAMVLQLEQQWTRMCAKVIQNIGEDHASSILCPILVPSPVENASTRCLLDPEDKEYSGKIPLRVKIPINQLYGPWRMLHILCHEMAHYCGEGMRNRHLRLEAMGKAAVHFIFDLFVRNIQKEYPKLSLFKSELFFNEVVEEITQDLLAQMGKNYYLKDTITNLIAIAGELIANEEFHAHFVRRVCKDCTSFDQLSALQLLARTAAVQTGLIIQQQVERHIEFCLGDLCKECYADIVMVLLLDCTFQDYFECVYASEEQKLSKCSLPNLPEVAIELHVTRMALVISALNTVYLKLNGKEWCEDTDCTSPWAKRAKEKSKSYEPGDSAAELPQIDSEWCILTRGEANCILKYLKDVAQSLKEHIQKAGQAPAQAEKSPSADEENTVFRLREILGYTKSESFDWASIRQFVEDYKRK